MDIFTHACIFSCVLCIGLCVTLHLHMSVVLICMASPFSISLPRYVLRTVSAYFSPALLFYHVLPFTCFLCFGSLYLLLKRFYLLPAAHSGILSNTCQMLTMAYHAPATYHSQVTTCSLLPIIYVLVLATYLSMLTTH